MSSPGPIFVSFTRADREWAEWIASEIEAAGSKAVFQYWDFPPGSNFVLEMHKAAAGCDRTFIVLSPDYLQSEFCKPEWAAAFAQDPTGAQRKLVPIRIKPCEPDGLLRAIVYTDLVNLDETSARAALVRTINGASRPAPGSVAFPSSKPKPRFPGTLPAIWNVSARNPNYLDRDDLLRRLHAALQQGTAASGYGKVRP